MRRRSLGSVAAAAGGRVSGQDVQVTGVAADSTEAGPGDLFIALRGERVDGHSYVGDAVARGAVAAMVDRDDGVGVPSVVVADTRRGLLDLARDERKALAGVVLAITGSVGKTSVKDLAASVLATRRRVVASPRSFNTEVGVPLTLLAAAPDTEVVVCEMGSRGAGHVRLLVETARPQIGLVTSVGPAHLEMFGSLEAVADAKAELVEGLPSDGVAILNADDSVVAGFADRTPARLLRYGVREDAEVRGSGLVLDAQGRASFTLHTPHDSALVELTVSGEHMAWNALAASAAGVALGLTAAECAAGLKDARVSPWRMETFDTPGGLRVINDAYNANPLSMSAALKAAKSMAGAGRCIAVLGAMAELGAQSPVEHERIGELVARLGIERLVVVGADARLLAVGALREGVEPDDVTTCDSVEDAAVAVRETAAPGDVVLIKGSRRTGLERIAELLRTEVAAP